MTPEAIREKLLELAGRFSSIACWEYDPCKEQAFFVVPPYDSVTFFAEDIEDLTVTQLFYVVLGSDAETEREVARERSRPTASEKRDTEPCPAPSEERKWKQFNSSHEVDTPSCIAELIRAGLGPHGQGERGGLAPFMFREQMGREPARRCTCVLCALPRGPAWGEVELERKIAWMGDTAHRSLHALGAWIHRGENAADRLTKS